MLLAFVIRALITHPRRSGGSEEGGIMIRALFAVMVFASRVVCSIQMLRCVDPWSMTRKVGESTKRRTFGCCC